MVWKELFQKGRERLEKAAVSDAGTDAWYLLSHVSGMSRADYFLKEGEEAAEELQERYLALTDRRCQHIPLQHLTGTWEFMGLEFMVSPDVLIPRQDTELLVETVLSLAEGKRVLDLCTGSGCIAISLAKLGKPLLVHGTDLSAAALEIADKNAKKLQAEVKFWQSDLYENIAERYDMIVTNPPYIRSDVIPVLEEEVREHEPLMALDGGADGLDFYRRIIGGAAGRLDAGGILAAEIGFDQAEAVMGIFEANGFHEAECLKDLCGNDRVIIGRCQPSC